MSWRLVVLAAASTLAIGAGGAFPVPARAGSRCSREGRTVISNSQSRVFSHHRWITESGIRRRYKVFFGCVRRTNRIFALRVAGYRMVSGPYDAVRMPRLNGAYFAIVHVNADSQAWAVAAWDLASGRNTYDDYFNWESDLPVDIEVGIHGGLAWIEPWGAASVTKVDRSGRAKIGRADVAREGVYEGDPLPSALTIDGDAVTWQDHATPRTYVLDGTAQNVAR